MATQPVLGVVTLPHPSGYSEVVDYRASAHTMADGGVAYQYISTSDKRTFTLTWTNVTTANKTTIETAIQDVVDDADGHVSFTAPTGTAYTVERPATGASSTFTAVSASGTLYWSGSLVLREV